MTTTKPVRLIKISLLAAFGPEQAGEPSWETLGDAAADLLRDHGDDTARAAAKAVMGRDDRDHLATKADIVSLKVEMVEMKAELIKWSVGTLVALAGIVAAIVKLV